MRGGKRRRRYFGSFLQLLEKDADIQVIQLDGLRHFTIPMDTRSAPFDNNDVRLGLKLLINREEILDKLLRGQGSVGNDHPISKVNRYHNGELEQRAYDPDKAKFHLKKGGAEGLSVELHASPGAFSESVDMAILLQESASKAGATINVKRMPADGYWADVWSKVPWCFSYWSGRPTEDWMFTQAYAAEAPWNDTFWQHAEFNRLLVAARVELDDTKRREMYYEMQRIVRDEGATPVPAFQDQISAASTRLQFKEPLAKHRAWDGNKMAERWWFA